MKKILSVMLLTLSAILLVACGTSSKQSLEGKYYEFYNTTSEKTFISSGDFLEFSSETVKTWDGEYLVDQEKKVVELGDGKVKSYTVDSSTGVVTLDEKTYVKVGSDYYQKLLDEGAVE